MAIVGEAHVLVRAITTGVERDIKNAFQGINGNAAEGAGSELGNSFSRGLRKNLNNDIFSKISNALGEMAPGAEAARLAFQRMVRSSYVAGTALSVLIGTISSLIGGLTALIGVAGAAAAGLVAVAGAAVALRVGFGIAGYALKGISQAVAAATQANGGYSKSLKEIAFDAEEAALSVDRAAINLENAREAVLRTQDLPAGSRVRREAELAYKEAELAYRRAQAAKKAGSTGQPGAADPYAGLTPSQKQFAQYLASLNPLFKDLKEAAAKGFLPILEEQIKRLISAGLITTLQKQFYNVGVGMGEMSKRFTDVLIIRETIKSLNDLLFRISKQLPPIGTIFGNLLDGFINALRLADPATKNFISYLEKKSGKFADFFTVKGNVEDNPISKFFVDAEKLLERFSGIFGNVFKALKTVIAANFGPGSGGEIMLSWLEKATAGWANMGRDIYGNLTPAFKDFFVGAATNTVKILESVGALVKEFLKLGNMPEIGETFDILKQGAPAMGELLRAGIAAGPALARLVVQIVRIFKALADSESPKVFFDTLTTFATKVADVLETEVAQKILKSIGGFLAFALAIGTVTKVFKFFGNVAVGVFKNLSGMVSGFLGGLGKVQGFFMQMNLGARDLISKGGFLNNIFGKFGLSLSRLGAFFTSFPGVAVIATLVTLFVDLYNNSETFRATVEATLSGIGEAFGRLWDSLMGLFEQLFGGEGLGGVMEAIRPITELILGTVFPLIGNAISLVIDTVATAINYITSVARTVMNIVKPLVSGIMDLFKGNFQTGMAKIFGSMGIMLLGIVEVIINSIIGGINLLLNVINGLLKSVGDGPIGQFLKTVTGGAINLSNVKLKIDYVNWTGNAKAALSKSTGTKMAEGGTVYPSMGGTMVTVAEAGRPERIEPLNPNGLSDRDIAIINKLSGGKGESSVQINVYASPGMNETEIANIVSRKIAFAMTKGGY